VYKIDTAPLIEKQSLAVAICPAHEPGARRLFWPGGIVSACASGWECSWVGASTGSVTEYEWVLACVSGWEYSWVGASTGWEWVLVILGGSECL
jgi:hypothetical protein